MGRGRGGRARFSQAHIAPEVRALRTSRVQAAYRKLGARFHAAHAEKANCKTEHSPDRTIDTIVYRSAGVSTHRVSRGHLAVRVC